MKHPPSYDGKDIVRGPQYVAVGDNSASLDCFEATAAIAEERLSSRGPVSRMVDLDEETANTLLDAIGIIELQSLRWMGYAEALHTSSPRRVLWEYYFQARLRPGR